MVFGVDMAFGPERYVRGELRRCGMSADALLRQIARQATNARSRRRAPHHRRDALVRWRICNGARLNSNRRWRSSTPSETAISAFRIRPGCRRRRDGFLALTLWPMGEIETARAQVDETWRPRDCTACDHPGSIAYGRCTSLFRLMTRKRCDSRLRAPAERSDARRKRPRYATLERPMRLAVGLEDSGETAKAARNRRNASRPTADAGIRNRTVSDAYTALNCASAKLESARSARRLTTIDTASHDSERTGQTLVRRRTPPHPRRNPAQTNPRRPRPRRSRLPHRHRHRAIAESPQLRTARRARAGKTLPINQPPGRSPRRPRPRARRLLADAGVSGDRGGEGAVRGACGGREVKAEAARRAQRLQSASRLRQRADHAVARATAAEETDSGLRTRRES